MATITKTVAAADELCYHALYGTQEVGVLQFGLNKNLGLIARLVGIPQGTVPTLVELSLAVSAGTGTAGGTIYGVAVDSARSWRAGGLETDRVVPDGAVLTFTTATATIPTDNTAGTLTCDITDICTEILGRAGWLPGYNLALVIVGNGTDIRYVGSGACVLTFTLASLPAATAYRIESHLAGQKIVLADDSILELDTLKGLIDLESQDIVVAPNGDADGVVITLASDQTGTFSPTTLTLSGSNPGTFRYTPGSTNYKHFLSATNDGGLTDPAAIRFMVRRSRLFPDSAIWYKDISATPLDTTGLHARFASYSGSHMVVFTGTKYLGHMVEQYINYRDSTTDSRTDFLVDHYVSESDPVDVDGKLPLGEKFLIEGYPYPSGDHHGLLFDVATNTLHEMYSMAPDGAGGYHGYHAKWDVTSLTIRTLGNTSAAADGRPVTPFILTYDEVLKALATDGIVPHPLRFTIPFTASAGRYVWDASHGTYNGGEDSPMYGTRMRLKASFDISGYSPVNQVILRTLKKYGAILADGGLAWYFTAEVDQRWDQTQLSEFNYGPYPYNDFETVDQTVYKVADTTYAALSEIVTVRRRAFRRGRHIVV